MTAIIRGEGPRDAEIVMIGEAGGEIIGVELLRVLVIEFEDHGLPHSVIPLQPVGQGPRAAHEDGSEMGFPGTGLLLVSWRSSSRQAHLWDPRRRTDACGGSVRSGHGEERRQAYAATRR